MGDDHIDDVLLRISAIMLLLRKCERLSGVVNEPGSESKRPSTAHDVHREVVSTSCAKPWHPIIARYSAVYARM
jgi:hypothetical protein